MDNITASELAGFGVGTLLLCATIAAPKIDSFISASQRSSLGICKTCGDLKRIACSSCRGTGSVKVGAFIRLGLVDDILQSRGITTETTRCTKCSSKGRFRCPDCSAS